MWKWEAEGEAKAVVVIVHGAFEHHRRYGWLIEMWRLSGFHVIMGDLPGQGMTTRANRGHIDSFEEYIYEVKDWIQAAYGFGTGPVFLLGHSYGGINRNPIITGGKVEYCWGDLITPCLGLRKGPSKLLDLLSIPLNLLMPSIRFNSGVTVQMATRNDEVRVADSNDTLYVTRVSIRWYGSSWIISNFPLKGLDKFKIYLFLLCKEERMSS